MEDEERDEYQGLPEPQPLKIVHDLATLRVLTDPLRMRILALLEEKPRTVKEVARMLDLPPTRLYYHFNLLEKHDIIRVVGTRVVSGIIEKRYWITARHFEVDHALFTPATSAAREEWLQTINMILGSLKEDMVTLMEQGIVRKALAEDSPDAPLVWLVRGVTRLSHAQARALRKRIEQILAEEFATPDEGAQEYTYLMGLYVTPEEKGGDSQT